MWLRELVLKLSDPGLHGNVCDSTGSRDEEGEVGMNVLCDCLVVCWLATSLQSNGFGDNQVMLCLCDFKVVLLDVSDNTSACLWRVTSAEGSQRPTMPSKSMQTCTLHVSVNKQTTAAGSPSAASSSVPSEKVFRE